MVKRPDVILRNKSEKQRLAVSYALKGRPAPWVRSNPQIFKKGYIPWIKGKHHTEE